MKWPAEIVAMYRVFSVFNFNLDLAAPECAMPNLDYDVKWFAIQLLPLGATVLFIGCHMLCVVFYFYFILSNSLPLFCCALTFYDLDMTREFYQNH